MKAETIHEILPDIYRIPVPLKGNPLKELNSYVIRGRKNLLVDTGFRTKECKEALLEALAFLNIRLEDTDILLTHLHADHSGNAAELVSNGNRVYISAIDREYLTGSKAENSDGHLHSTRDERFRRNGISQEMINDMLRDAPFRTMAADPDFDGYTTVADGDEISAGLYTLRAIHTPGHTPGHMCFEIKDTGAMLLGDHVLFDITPNITDWMGVEDSLGDYLASLDKIDQYDVTIPLPGHRACADFHGRIKELKEHHRQRLEECRSVIGRLEKAYLYDITGNMSWRIRADSWESFPPAQRLFALGECLSHIDHLVKTGKIVMREEDGTFWYESA